MFADLEFHSGSIAGTQSTTSNSEPVQSSRNLPNVSVINLFLKTVFPCPKCSYEYLPLCDEDIVSL